MTQHLGRRHRGLDRTAAADHLEGQWGMVAVGRTAVAEEVRHIAVVEEEHRIGLVVDPV